MGLFSTPIKTLDDLFIHTLRDMYYAEHQMTKALPDMIGKATNPQLKAGLQSHLGETENQIRRLEQVFRMQGKEPGGVTCEAIDGIIAEAKQVMSDVGDRDVLDAAMITSAQAVEHYEISRYGSLIALARQLGRDDCARVLEQTLQEEKAADRKLTEVAESQVNRRAVA